MSAETFKTAMEGGDREFMRLPDLVNVARQSVLANDATLLPGHKKASFVTIGVLVREFEAKSDKSGNRYKSVYISDFGNATVSVMLYEQAMNRNYHTLSGTYLTLI